MIKVKLHEIASFSKGQQINGDLLIDDGTFDYLNGGVTASGKWNESNVEGNTITISEGGNSCGYVNYMTSRFWCGAHCYYLFNLKCESKYLYYALKSQQDRIMSLRSGACMPNIRKNDLAEIVLNICPNREEQLKVVKVLDSICNLIVLCKRQLAKLDDLVKARFVEMFGDPASNSKNWPMVSLGELAEIRIGPFGTLLHSEDYIQNGHPLVNPSHIFDGKIITDPMLTISDEKYAELSAYVLQQNDIVLGRRGEMGRCAVVSQRGLLCGTGSMIIRPSGRMLSYFLQNILSSPSYKKIIEDKAVGVTMKNLNVPIVSSLMIPLLPLELQEQYIGLLNKIDVAKLTIRQGLDKLETLKKALMQKYFRGGGNHEDSSCGNTN